MRSNAEASFASQLKVVTIVQLAVHVDLVYLDNRCQMSYNSLQQTAVVWLSPFSILELENSMNFDVDKTFIAIIRLECPSRTYFEFLCQDLWLAVPSRHATMSTE